MKRLVLCLVLAGVVGWVVYLLSLAGILQGLAGLGMNVLAVYLVWRAWPAVRDDLAALRAVLPGVSLRRTRGGHL